MFVLVSFGSSHICALLSFFAGGGGDLYFRISVFFYLYS